MLNNRFTRTLLPLLSLSALGACLDEKASTQAGTDDAALNPVAVVTRANGNQVHFYEPVAGQIITLEVGTERTLPKMADAMAVYRAAAPATEVPLALVEANLRARATATRDHAGQAFRSSLPTDHAFDQLPTAPLPTTASAGACDPNQFVNDQCYGGDFHWCKVTWSNGFYAYASDADWMHNAVCGLTGTVTLRLIVDSDLKASYEVSPGTIYLHNWYGGDFSFRTEVINASGDTFRVGGAAQTS